MGVLLIEIIEICSDSKPVRVAILSLSLSKVS